MLLAVAMNEWLTVTTSSPRPTPAARRAKCSPTVQLDTAHACLAPTAAANSASNAATSGPCVTQPERSGRRAASARAWRPESSGHRLFRGLADTVHLPPGDQAAKPVLEADARAEAKAVSRRPRARHTPGHGVDLALGRVLDAEVRAHDFHQK